MLLVRVSGSPRDFVRRLQATARGLDDRLQPTVQVMGMAFFAAVIALSILAPGRRATRINPLRALQHE